MQKAMFPMDFLRVTQKANGLFSHKGSLALDLGGKDTGSDKVFAPCDMEIVRVRNDSSHEIYAQSIDKVMFADGTVDSINFVWMHDDYINSNVKVGAVIKQGEYFMDEGGFGRGKRRLFAAHLHLEVGRGKSPKTQIRNRYGTYVLPNQYPIEKALFLSPTTKILNDGGYAWQKTTETTVDIPWQFKRYNIKPISRGINIRTGPGVNYKSIGFFDPQYQYTVLEESGRWGRTPVGWIHLDYAKKM